MPEQGGLERSLPLMEFKPDPDLNQPITSTSPLTQALELSLQNRDKFKLLEEYLVGMRDVLIAAHDEVTTRVNELPVMAPLTFFQDTVAASQTDIALGDPGAGRGYIAVEDGSIVSVSVRVDDPRTAGSLTVEPTINGTKIGFSVTLNGADTTFKYDRQDQGLDVFLAGDRIGAVITSDGAWLPTTANIDVSVGVVFSKGVR
jgi:hypothetical protein